MAVESNDLKAHLDIVDRQLAATDNLIGDLQHGGFRLSLSAADRRRSEHTRFSDGAELHEMGPYPSNRPSRNQRQRLREVCCSWDGHRWSLRGASSPGAANRWENSI